MWPPLQSAFFSLRCIIFLPNAAVFVDLALYLAVGGLASVELFALFLSSSPARDLQHITWRLSCCLLEVRNQQNLDFAASHHLGHLCFSWHVWNRCSFLRYLDPFLKLRHVEEFPGCPHFIWDILL